MLAKELYRPTHAVFALGLFITLVSFICVDCSAEPFPYRTVQINVKTGPHSGVPNVEVPGPGNKSIRDGFSPLNSPQLIGEDDANISDHRVVFSKNVAIEGAIWLIVKLDKYDLGKGSFARLTSLRDGTKQEFNQQHLLEYEGYFAPINGSTFRIELIAHPDDLDVFFSIDDVIAGSPQAQALEHINDETSFLPGEKKPQQATRRPEQLCENRDHRQSTTDPRIGRIVPAACTGWISENGLLVTAGHCVGTDFTFIQFDVPPSRGDGTIQHPQPSNSYKINLRTVKRSDQGVGDDWAVFSAKANSVTGLTPFKAQKRSFKISSESSVDTPIRVTGYGADSDPPGTRGLWNQSHHTLQTHSAVLIATTDDLPYSLEYMADSAGGDSGSPIERLDNAGQPTGDAIGIHTHSGCNPPHSGNVGTSLANPKLLSAIRSINQ